MAINSAAIIGAGYSGVSLAWYLASKGSGKIKVKLFDSEGIAGGASGLSAGLLHPFAGLHAKLNWKGREGMEATQELIKVSESHLGRSISTKKGILRPALTLQQLADFKICSETYSEVQLCTPEECQKLAPGIIPLPGIHITSGQVVVPKLYLEGLWGACENKGAVFEKKKINSLSDLKDFEVIIVTAGLATLRFPELQHLSLKGIKGQIIELAWPKGMPPLPIAINSNKYITMSPDGQSCLVGATFERSYTSVDINSEVANKDILPEIEKLFPSLKNAKILGYRSGVRVSTPNHLPIVGKIKDKLWVLVGLGSKGLLHHAFLSDQLSNNILKS